MTKMNSKRKNRSKETNAMSKRAAVKSSSMATPLGSDREGGPAPSPRRDPGRADPTDPTGADRAESSRPTWISGGYDSLPEVPMFYPIERTSAVASCCDPRAVAGRIATCLQKLSITADFNASEASFHAEALDYTMFYIRLYKNENINNRGILVELQRVDGDPFNFIKYARTILASARGEAIDESKTTSRRSSLSYIPAPILQCHSEKSRQEDTSSEHIMHVEELLQKDRLDAVLLGIESLLLLTDQERSQASLSAAETVLSGGGHSAIKDFIHKCIRRPRAALSPEDGAFEHASRQCRTLHNSALAVLGNSLQTASGAKGATLLRSLPRSEEWTGRSGIVDSLLSELSRAEDRPHDAYHAARCLNMLLDSGMRKELIERGLPDAMRVSRSVGRRRHSLLARECDTALAVMADVQ